jgi:uncharacterized protein
MKSPDDVNAQTPEQGFQFPGVFEITAMGPADVDLPARIERILAEFELTVIAGSQRVRPSREGRYVAVTIAFNCPDRERYDAVHEALRSDEHVKWTL